MKTQTEILDAIQAEGPHWRLSYKLKTRDMNDLEFWRHTGNGWRDVYTGEVLSDKELLSRLSVGKRLGFIVTVFACCCGACMTEETRQFQRQFFQRTGIPISHGYAPECFDAEMKRINDLP